MDDNIIEVIHKEIKEFKITSLDISFNELADMYQSEELIITPNYQRTFRWNISKQSRFIETLILEMPIPPIYAIEIEDGKYELIDGLQRISSYLNFRGLLKKQDSDNEPIQSEQQEDEDQDIEEFDELSQEDIYSNGFSLIGCDIIPDLDGRTYESLPAGIKIKLKRSFVRMEVLRKGMNTELKYHMFKRLNTGGEILTPQELRNCTIRLIDNKFIDFISSLSKNKDFQDTIHYISANRKAKQMDDELVLRFFAFKNDGNSFVHDVNLFLTTYMEKVSLSDVTNNPIFDYENEQKTFENTFGIINKALGKEAFAQYKANSTKWAGFNIYLFEAITRGIQTIYDELMEGKINLELFAESIRNAKTNPELQKMTVGGGKNSSGLSKARYQFIINILGELKNGL